ncbi:co-chaperone protein HscB homolog [Euwallacea fornicatus]|uniref:co-chaperone protein HscB homolog n=1 Tax=Euwallacea fornicatus TaxID=995702 RepID=UPI00338E841F
MYLFNKLRYLSPILQSSSFERFHTLKTLIKPFTITSYKNASQRFNQNVCWKCGLERKNAANVFCEECNVIQNPQETHNYFKVFNLEERFNLDTKELKDKYRKLQSYLHPDKFSTKSNEEKEISANYSSLVNKAYNSLQVPLRRAEHLLDLKGNSLEEGQTVDDPEFLMVMMELNEELENTNDVEQLKKLEVKNRNQLEKITKNIDECFRNNDLKQAKHYVIKMKYYSSLGNRINALMRELGVID